MGKITVTVIDVTGNKEQQASLPDDAAVRRIITKLVQMMDLPTVGPDGAPLSYRFRHKATGKELGDDQTLGEAGVQEGDVLRLEPELTAG